MKKTFQNEYLGAKLGDQRRSARLIGLGDSLALFPAASFPDAFGSDAELEAAYRFFSNECVEADSLIAPHREASAARCRERGNVIVAHDTTEFTFPGDGRRDLGRMRKGKAQGFFAHMALAICEGAWSEPLGILRAEMWKRTKRVTKSAWKQRKDPNREFTRWFRGIESVEKQLEPGTALHVMDREADAYELFSQLIDANIRFVIRASHDRNTTAGEKAFACAESKPILLTREVPLSKRARSPFPQRRKIHPPRNARMANLGVKATAIELTRPDGLSTKSSPRSLSLNIVVVEEIDSPKNEPAVLWRLCTTEPIKTAKDLERIVDAYRRRWLIEEFFKALKTGCAIEKRQLETYHALRNATAVFIPIAWRMLRLRTLAHNDRKRSASTILTRTQIKILRRTAKMKLPRFLSIEQALRNIAALGGHLKRNGNPGWLTIARGYIKLLTLEEGVLLGADL